MHKHTEYLQMSEVFDVLVYVQLVGAMFEAHQVSLNTQLDLVPTDSRVASPLDMGTTYNSIID